MGRAKGAELRGTEFSQISHLWADFPENWYTKQIEVGDSEFDRFEVGGAKGAELHGQNLAKSCIYWRIVLKMDQYTKFRSKNPNLALYLT